MSRSYKKNPYVTDKSAGTKSMKRIATYCQSYSAPAP